MTDHVRYNASGAERIAVVCVGSASENMYLYSAANDISDVDGDIWANTLEICVYFFSLMYKD